MRKPLHLAAVLLAFLVAPAGAGEDTAAAVLLSFNERLIATAIAEDKLLTLKGVRTAAMMHIAMHDAINATQRRYSAYALREDVPGTDPVAAAAQAAYEVIVSQYPSQQAELRCELEHWQDASKPETARARDLGRRAAAVILALRSDDGWDVPAEYRWHPMAPGVYAEFHEHSGTPKGFVFGAGWARVKPFALLRPEQVRAPPPPRIGSDQYLAAFEEVKAYGRYQSPQRTADQTHLALWWKDFVENSHNRLARQLVRERNVDLWRAARLFALLNVSVMDAYVSSFDSKFHYNHWRPFTAIRWAEHDGEPRTPADPAWDNTHRHTYPWPSYPSAHAGACAAAMAPMIDTFGDDVPFTMQTREVDTAGPMSEKMVMEPATRSFTSFSQAAMECALSRVYLGIHFRYDSLAGNRQGSQVGGYVLAHHLLPVGTDAAQTRPR